MEKLIAAWKLGSSEDLDETNSFKEREYKIERRLLYSKPNNVFVGLEYFHVDGYKSRVDFWR